MRELIECSGAIICARTTHRVLLVQKQYGKHAGRWGLVGGKNTKEETSWTGLVREIEEEIGNYPKIEKVLPLDKFVSDDNYFNFTTFFCLVNNEFLPTLSEEHMAWGWFDLAALPKPVHKSLGISLDSPIIQSKIKSIIEIANEI